MSLVEFIGFAISLIALVVLYFRNRQEVRYRLEHPEEFKDEEVLEEEEEGYPLKDFIKKLEKELTEKEKLKHPSPPLPPLPQSKEHSKRTIQEDYHLKSAIEQRRIKSILEDRRLKTKLHKPDQEISQISPDEKLLQPSKGLAAIQRLAHRRDLIIYQEIMNKPKSLRTE